MAVIYRVVTPDKIGKALAFNPITNLLDVQLSDDTDSVLHLDDQNRLKVVPGRKVIDFDPATLAEEPATLYLDDGRKYLENNTVLIQDLKGYSVLAPIGTPPVNTGALIGVPTLTSNTSTAPEGPLLFDIGTNEFTITFTGGDDLCNAPNKQFNIYFYLVPGKPPENDDGSWFMARAAKSDLIAISVTNDGISFPDADIQLEKFNTQPGSFSLNPGNGYTIEPINFSIKNNKIFIFDNAVSNYAIYDLTGTTLENLNSDEMTVLPYIEYRHSNNENNNINSPLTVSIYNSTSYERHITIPDNASGTINIDINPSAADFKGGAIVFTTNKTIYPDLSIWKDNDCTLFIAPDSNNPPEQIFMHSFMNGKPHLNAFDIQSTISLTIDKGVIKFGTQGLLTYTGTLYIQQFGGGLPFKNALNKTNEGLPVTFQNFTNIVYIENELPDVTSGSMVRITKDAPYKGQQLFKDDIFEIDAQNNPVLIYGAKHTTNIIQENNNILQTKIKNDVSKIYEPKLPAFTSGTAAEYVLTGDKKWSRLQPADMPLDTNYTMYYQYYGYYSDRPERVYESDTIAAGVAKLQRQIEYIKGLPEPPVIFNPEQYVLTGQKQWQNISYFLQGYLQAHQMYNITNSTYTVGTNTPISNTDTLNQQLGNLQAQVSNKEGSIAAGTTTQYYRGDKTWQPLSSDVLNITLNGISTTDNSAITASDNLLSGVGKLQAQLNDKEPTIPAGSAGQYWDGTKTWKTLPSGGGGGLTNLTEVVSRTSPNNTVPAMGIAAAGTEANIDLVLAPKGSGAIVAYIPNGTTTGGNKRGQYAVDLQLYRGTSAQVASGFCSFVTGMSNTVSGTSSASLGAYQVVSNNHSLGCGYATKTRTDFSISLGTYNGYQTHIAPLSKQTTNAATTPLTYPVLVSSLRDIKGRLIAKNSTNTEFAVWDIAAILTCGSAASSHAFLGTPTATSVASTSGASEWTATLSVDSTGMKINITGAASTTINWLATLYVQELY